MLRFVDTYETRHRVMGGTDDGIMPFEVDQLFVGDVCLANAVNISDFEDERTQVMVCETCGVIGCGSGGWIHQRAIGEDVAWIPPRKLSEHDAKFDWQESPPQYCASNTFGIPVFRGKTYDELRGELPWLPNRSAIQPIRACEALLILQGEAPFELLGRAPQAPRVNRELTVAVAEGDLKQELDAVDSFLTGFATCETPMQPVDANAEYRQIEFYIDAPRFPAWSGICRLSTGIGMMLGPWRPLRLISSDAQLNLPD